VSKFWLLTVPRVVLGVVFLVGAIDGFAFILNGTHLFHPPTTERGLQFEEALKSAGFLWPLMKTVELVGAACLLTHRAPALGLALLSPVMTVVVLFHGFLNPGGHHWRPCWWSAVHCCCCAPMHLAIRACLRRVHQHRLTRCRS
jgi:uncharacterized membrane protein YphA (DoxX/SURF4 family)